MNKKSRLKHLPPAARIASVRKYDQNGGLLIVTRYVQEPREWSSRSVHPGAELWGVPYEVWRQHLGRQVRLWEWHGTDEGMIGGPAKRQGMDCLIFGGVWEWPDSYTHDERLHYADRLEQWLADDRYEFCACSRAKVESKIISLRHSGRGLTHVEEWLEEMRQGKTEP